MKLIVNGQVCDVSAKSLEMLLFELGFEGDWLATAVNSELVRATERNSHSLKNGDRIEILTPKQGG
ncbi:sulfur carrier protein ThiS [Phyllobacterium sp. YR531]|uniref:sulfur carrier protein ThiS n=1 Tax=Phyllobacterium sp. YR531 TaxID=1144343 RepID=UPI00026F86FC|nr:sulfur carrier protein ThiS [Phyllobacterium sp. YR531]EJN04018.1 thiamine biosynthesis protein ThiS [Phyllobacterium sp. YR531]